MRRNLLFFISNLFLLFLFFVVSVNAGSTHRYETETDIYGQHLSRLQQAYSELSSITFSFAQVTRSGTRSRSGQGDALFVRLPDPDRIGIMRWNYTYPDFQIILNDGEKLSIYTERDNQLIITPAAMFNNDITFGLFAGEKSINDDFIAGPPEEWHMLYFYGVSLTSISLIPSEPHPQIKFMQVWFDEKSLIRYLVLIDHFESITELAFFGNAINTIDVNNMQEMEKILFLDIPEDTEIVRQ